MTTRELLTQRLALAQAVAAAVDAVVDGATSLSLDDVSDRAELKRQLGEAVVAALRDYKETT